MELRELSRFLHFLHVNIVNPRSQFLLRVRIVFVVGASVYSIHTLKTSWVQNCCYVGAAVYRHGDELTGCHFCTPIPVAEDNASKNISQGQVEESIPAIQRPLQNKCCA